MRQTEVEEELKMFQKSNSEFLQQEKVDVILCVFFLYLSSLQHFSREKAMKPIKERVRLAYILITAV